MIAEAHVDPAVATRTGAGFTVQRPPAGWLFKAWIGDTLVDMLAIRKPVLPPTAVMVAG